MKLICSSCRKFICIGIETEDLSSPITVSVELETNLITDTTSDFYAICQSCERDYNE